jgi:hypothetical protein
MQRHGNNRFKFVDEALPVPLMRQLSEMILSDGVKVEWEAYTRLERAWANPEFVELVSAAGFKKGYFGLEVLPSTNRLLMNKKDQADPAELLTTCWRAGVKTHLFCMFGYPGTGREDAEATVRFLLERQDLIDTADIFPWTYTKHTHVLGAEPILAEGRDWALEFDHRPTQPGGLSSAEVVALANDYEEVLWQEVPRFLHPTYRLVSPWQLENAEKNLMGWKLLAQKLIEMAVRKVACDPAKQRIHYDHTTRPNVPLWVK